jgi:hypothetical protein
VRAGLTGDGVLWADGQVVEIVVGHGGGVGANRLNGAAEFPAGIVAVRRDPAMMLAIGQLKGISTAARKALLIALGILAVCWILQITNSVDHYMRTMRHAVGAETSSGPVNRMNGLKLWSGSTRSWR